MRCIYVCHTYYHVFVSVLKELNKPQDLQGHATMVLSKMSTDFETLKERLEKSNLFEEVIEFDEKCLISFRMLWNGKRIAVT